MHVAISSCAGRKGVSRISLLSMSSAPSLTRIRVPPADVFFSDARVPRLPLLHYRQDVKWSLLQIIKFASDGTAPASSAAPSDSR